MLHNENKHLEAMHKNIVPHRIALSVSLCAYHVSLQNVTAFHVLQTIFTDIELRKSATIKLHKLVKKGHIVF